MPVLLQLTKWTGRDYTAEQSSDKSPTRSSDLFAIAKDVIPSGVNSPVRYYPPFPFFAERAEKGSIWDADGRRYLDLCNGYGALLLGHGREEIISAVSEQLRKGEIFCVPTERESELAGKIRRNYPSMERVRLVNTGGEATMAAVRLVRGFTKRNKILKFDGCYHGAHDAMLVGAGSGSAHAGLSTSDGVSERLASETLVVPYNDPATLDDALSKNDDVAGVIIEPVMGNMGVILPSDGFLEEVRKITIQNDVPLVFDEVITGFRLAPGGAQEIYSVKPDVTTLGKALGGGFPIAAVGGSTEIMEQLAPGGRVYQASTFAGNPVSVSAAMASIDTIGRERGMYHDLERRCSHLAGMVGDAASDAGIAHRINRIASIFQIFFIDGPVSNADAARRADAARFARLFRGLLENGVFIAPSQFETAFISAAHSDEEISRIAGAYEAALAGVS